ncbi:cGMP-dependent protein kinase, isozyme 2 forms cD4/T1/T3A/T3B [Schistosoma japonicum]|nr:cGMP-dependent protein kinase, isozyme 2 forms cD4/T1/T3A/T3B [Schistosoma japonicum]
MCSYISKYCDCLKMHAKCQQEIQQQHELIIKLQEDLFDKNKRISELTGLLDKYQSVFNQPTSLSTPGVGVKSQKQQPKLGHVDSNEVFGFGGSLKPPILDSVVQTRKRGIGISAEPQNEDEIQSKELTKHPKSESIRKLIKNAILENEFMNHIASSELNQLIDCMYSIEFIAEDMIINEGEYGSLVYVLAEGQLEILKDGRKLRVLDRPTVLGELAVLYNCTRTASVKALTNGTLWAIDRTSFQTILMRNHLQKHNDYITFLKSVPTFSNLSDSTISKLADRLNEVTYRPNEYIIRQGARGDNFYIIADGQVNVTIYPTTENGTTDRTKEPQFVRTLGRGDWFGEKALTGDNLRTANIIATDAGGVTCLALDLESYSLLIADLAELKRDYTEEKLKETKIEEYKPEFKSLQLTDLKVLSTLGAGGFGRVELVCIANDKTKTYALKKMKKQHIVETKQEEHVMNERNIMLRTDSDFIVRLCKTFKDNKYLYLLLEVCLGGELWSLLKDKTKNGYFFTEQATQFYVACVIEALNYLHRKNIVYRDLKPENIMLDTQGYCKLTDLGFAKQLPYGAKTWTFCGTPEYMAPEVILNKGHDIAVDHWSLGVLIFELLTGLPPFESQDTMRTYGIILKGIDAINFPTRMSKNAQNLVKKLCRENPTERYGAGKEGLSEIERHVWFEGFDWVGLRKHALKAPHERQVTSQSDLRHFDEYPEDTEEPEDETSGWDESF